MKGFFMRCCFCKASKRLVIAFLIGLVYIAAVLYLLIGEVMDLFDNRDWSILLEPLGLSYKDQSHPLHYKNRYQLIIMVILAAQDSDENINRLTIPFLKNILIGFL
jgi:hypothetical protein